MPDGVGGEGEQHFRTDLHATRPHEAQSMRAHSSLVVSVGSTDRQGRSSAHVLTDRAPVQLLICVSRLRLQAYITNIHGAPKTTRMAGPIRIPPKESRHFFRVCKRPARAARGARSAPEGRREAPRSGAGCRAAAQSAAAGG